MTIVSLVVAVIVSNVIGMLWYSPKMFGTKWKALLGMSEEVSQKCDKPEAKVMIVNVLFSLITAYVLWALVPVVGLIGIVLYWLGFTMPVIAGPVLWERKSWKLFLINAGYSLVAVLAMSVVVHFIR